MEFDFGILSVSRTVERSQLTQNKMTSADPQIYGVRSSASDEKGLVLNSSRSSLRHDDMTAADDCSTTSMAVRAPGMDNLSSNVPVSRDFPALPTTILAWVHRSPDVVERTFRMQSPYDIDLDRNAANYQALSPVNFLVRAAAVYPHKTAVIHGDTSFTYAEFYTRSRRLASALAKRGIGRGDTVSIMAPNVPPLLEAHYAVPMLGAVLNALNIRLDASAIAFMLDHGEAKVILTDRMFSGVIKEALEVATNTPLVIDIDDPLDQSGELLGEIDYETFLQEGDPEFTWTPPEDEWQALSLNYTSGTTGDPKGVVYHHRGAFLNALGNTISFGLSPQTVYLWTLPMFHCNGWTYTWAVTAACGTHVCLRAVDPALIFPIIEEHKVTHMCGAPIVLTM